MHSNERNGALMFFSDSRSFSGDSNVDYDLFLKTLRRAWLTRLPPGASGSMTGSRKLDAQLAIVKKKLREAATKQGQVGADAADRFPPARHERRRADRAEGVPEGLTQLGINVDMLLDIKRLIEFFDDDGDGTMDAYEFSSSC